MITANESIFHLTTKKLSYLIGIRAGRYPENLYFGKKIKQQNDYYALQEKFGNPYGNSVLINAKGEDKNITLDNLCLDYSFIGTGDYRVNPMTLRMEDTVYSSRFEYKDFVIYSGIYKDSDVTEMPFAREGKDGHSQTLELIFTDEYYSLELR